MYQHTPILHCINVASGNAEAAEFLQRYVVSISQTLFYVDRIKNMDLRSQNMAGSLPPALSDLHVDSLRVLKHYCFAVMAAYQYMDLQVTESRRQFAARLLQQCVRSKHGQTQYLCQALMIVEASEALDSAEGPELPASRASTNAARARSSAAGLLAEQSGNYSLYAALGWVLGLIGQHKVHTQLLCFLACEILPLHLFQSMSAHDDVQPASLREGASHGAPGWST